MHRLFTFLWQTAILWAIYRSSCWLVESTGLPVPGNVVGVALLFTLLCLGVVRLEHVSKASDFLLRHLVFFFIPITVGLMEWGAVFAEHWAVLAAAVLVSSFAPFWLVGRLTQWLHRRGRPCDS
ncbi:Antiholin-like protein LrgA [Fundidesulfovibrio magnetotacticus]|uniref:Antiholin-like protein LrgA n=1 Tax=Fundidesulfovibrio magnetotacticus TaxID=2730080 RepID=A0A6V8LZH7_9BACT|nr:CidA/LrgA family protein [Fundidesulfovibrio magnetotacticus]GFK95419.1 Antiholin-like protein LrgA [Fundidesulfovibrio magnetotacticus]